MLRQKDFIVFSDDWGRHPFSCQHLMEQFLKAGNRILWVNTIGLRTPRLTIYDIKRSFQKITSWLRPAQPSTTAPLPPNLRIVAPVMLPFNTFAPVRTCNRMSVTRTVRAAMEDMGMTAPILLATVPNAADYLGAFGESLVVYYCVDDFTLWPGMNQPEMVRAMEEAMLDRADLVVTTSTALQQSRARGQTTPKILTHGVDIEHFSRRPSCCPAEIANISKPILGFYGLIDQRLDSDLVCALLAKRPEWQWVFIGNSLIPLDTLKKFPNFHHVEAVDYARLPDFAASFAAAFLPYRVNAQTASINPLKLREYIATGKPVIATPLPEAINLAPAVTIASDAASFVACIERALQDNTPAEVRRAAVQGETWPDKAELLANWIDEALKEEK